MVDARRDDESIKTLNVDSTYFLAWALKVNWVQLNARQYSDFVYITTTENSMAGAHVLKDVMEYLFLTPDGRVVNVLSYNNHIMRITLRNFSTTETNLGLKGAAL